MADKPVEAPSDPAEVPQPPSSAEPRPATVAVRASKDLLKAWVHLSPPELDGRRLTEADILSAIRASGIMFGLKEAVVAKLGIDPVYNEDILVAEGIPPKHGDDAKVEYQIDLDHSGRPISEDVAGRVNYKELNLIKNVLKDQVLAVKKVAETGTPGTNIKRETIPARSGRDVKMSAGENVELSPDGLQARAMTDGAVTVLRGTITVSNVYRVSRSVGPETGNITFLGTVEIADSIEDGFTVKASENVVVGHTVGKATVDAGGDVMIRGGFVGANEGKVICGGTFRAKFLQEAHVEAKGDIIVGEGILHSHVQSGGSIFVGFEAKKGTIVGGQIRAWKKIACKVLGSPMSTKTLVDVGVNPKILAKLEELQTDIVKDRQNYDNIKKGIAALEMLREKMGGQLPIEKKRILETLELGKESFKTKLQSMALELRECQTQVTMSPDSSVSVHDELYAGVKISIGTAVFYTTQTEKFVTLKEEGGEIRTHTYEDPHIERLGDEHK